MVKMLDQMSLLPEPLIDRNDHRRYNEEPEPKTPDHLDKLQEAKERSNLDQELLRVDFKRYLKPVRKVLFIRVFGDPLD